VQETGAVVYPAPPQIDLGSIPGEDVDRWAAVIRYDGDLHELAGSDLLAAGAGVLDRFLDGQRRFVQVEVLLRGPLGTDFRSSFAVVPGLRIERPSALSVPGGPIVLVSIITAFGSERLEVPADEDVAFLPVVDNDGGHCALRVTVPCLQWALVTEGALSGPLSQKVVRLGTAALATAAQALLMIRTHMPGLALRLELRDGTSRLQEDVGTTSGEDGRWTFDLKRFASTAAASAAPELAMYLVAASYEIRVLELRAVASFANITIAQAVTDRDVHLEIDFDEDRVLRGRQVRIWPLTRPWLPPAVRAIPDEPRGQAIVDAAIEELPPGAYLVQVAVEAGWSTPTRPRYKSPGTADLRIGVQEQEAEWLARLPVTDPFRTLGKAYQEGRVSRWATPAMIRQLGQAPYLALLTLAEYWPLWHTAGDGAEAIAALLSLDLDSAVELGLGAVADRAITPGQLLVCALPMIHAALRGSVGHVAISAMHRLWELCPAWATVLELRNPLDAQRVTLEGRLGHDPRMASNCQLFPHAKELMPFLGMDARSLDAIRRAANLVPQRVLGEDTQPNAQLEWLLALEEGHLNLDRWLSRYSGLASELPEVGKATQDRFLSLRPNEGTCAAFPKVQFPAVTFAASLHLAALSPRLPMAMRALQEVAPSCPSIVNRSLALAAVLIGFDHSFPTWGKS
jgi:hypothetical protein